MHKQGTVWNSNMESWSISQIRYIHTCTAVPHVQRPCLLESKLEGAMSKIPDTLQKQEAQGTLTLGEDTINVHHCCLPGQYCTCLVQLLHRPQNCGQWISEPLHHCLGWRPAPPFQGQAQQSLLPCTKGERTRWTVYATHVPQQHNGAVTLQWSVTWHITLFETQNTFNITAGVVKHSWLYFLGNMHTLQQVH